MLSHDNYFSSLHIGTEIVHCLSDDYKNVLEKGCEHKEELCFCTLIFFIFRIYKQSNAFSSMLVSGIQSGSEIQTVFSLLALPYSPVARLSKWGRKR